MVDYLNIPVGHTIQQQCPECGKSEGFYITRKEYGQYAYICHRVTCDLKPGYVTTYSMADLYAGRNYEQEREERFRLAALRPARRFEGDTFSLEEEDSEYFRDKIGYVPKDIRKTTDGRFRIPLKDPIGRVRGYDLRVPWKDCPSRHFCEYTGKNKSDLYIHEQGPSLSWNTYEYGDDQAQVVLVEDVLSTLRLQYEEVRGVALLGTTLNQAKVREIGREGYANVIIALDADATDKAFEMAQRWCLAFEHCRVAVLDQDIKDLPLEYGAARHALGILQ